MSALSRPIADADAPQVAINRNQTAHPLNLRPNQRIVGHGVPVGQVYRLSDGRLIYIAPNTK